MRSNAQNIIHGRNPFAPFENANSLTLYVYVYFPIRNYANLKFIGNYCIQRIIVKIVVFVFFLNWKESENHFETSKKLSQTFFFCIYLSNKLQAECRWGSYISQPMLYFTQKKMVYVIIPWEVCWKLKKTNGETCQEAVKVCMKSGGKYFRSLIWMLTFGFCSFIYIYYYQCHFSDCNCLAYFENKWNLVTLYVHSHLNRNGSFSNNVICLAPLKKILTKQKIIELNSECFHSNENAITKSFFAHNSFFPHFPPYKWH